MVQAYNFLASWQLFPEKCNYQFGTTPKSGTYKIDSIQQGKQLSFTLNWISQDGEAFYSQYNIIPNGEKQPFENQEFADCFNADVINASTLCVVFFKEDKIVLKVTHEILANGFLKLTQEGNNTTGESYINVEIYHKQLSVLPYASSAGSVAIRPTKEGVIKHKALAAMEEQTNMHLNQIKEQIGNLQSSRNNPPPTKAWIKLEGVQFPVLETEDAFRYLISVPNKSHILFSQSERLCKNN